MAVSKEDVDLVQQNIINEALNEEGLTPSEYAKNLKRHLTAKTQKAFQSEGKIIYSKRMHDNRTQLDACKELGSALGVHKADSSERKVMFDISERLERAIKERARLDPEQGTA